MTLDKGYYKNMFADIVGDAGDADFNRAGMIVEAFQEAIGEWMQYHSEAAHQFLIMKEMSKDIKLPQIDS